MAVSSTSLLSGPKSVPPFTGLHRSQLETQSLSLSSFFDSQLRLCSSSSSRRPIRGVVSMAGTGKFFVGGNWKCNGTKESVTKLVFDLNSATLEQLMLWLHLPLSI